MEITIEIKSLSRSGAGIGREPTGRVVFVPLTAPGDTVRAKILTEDKRFAEAQLLEIIVPSKVRQNPPCPVFGLCGGCQWQHLPYELQWKTKSEGVFHSLKRVGAQTEAVPLVEFPAKQIWNYRNRIQLRGQTDRLGFYARKTKKIVPIETCPIARQEINACLSQVLDEGKSRSREYKVEVEVHPDGSVTKTWNSSHSALGFRQVHDEQNRVLQNWVSTAMNTEAEALLDLYGGSGNLSKPIAERYKKSYCVDLNSPEEESTDAFGFYRSSISEWLNKHKSTVSAHASMHVILDPPRDGLGYDLPLILDCLKAWPVTELLLIGCEPDSWARGVHKIQQSGFKLAGLGVLDFFPQTHHVESLAHFQRG